MTAIMFDLQNTSNPEICAFSVTIDNQCVSDDSTWNLHKRQIQEAVDARLKRCYEEIRMSSPNSEKTTVEIFLKMPLDVPSIKLLMDDIVKITKDLKYVGWSPALRSSLMRVTASATASTSNQGSGSCVPFKRKHPEGENEGKTSATVKSTSPSSPSSLSSPSTPSTPSASAVSAVSAISAVSVDNPSKRKRTEGKTSATAKSISTAAPSAPPPSASLPPPPSVPAVSAANQPRFFGVTSSDINRFNDLLIAANLNSRGPADQSTSGLPLINTSKKIFLDASSNFAGYPPAGKP